MPLPPPGPATAGRATNPARILLDSPLAAATRGRVNRRRARLLPPDRVRRVLAMAGAMLVHVIFLLGFVLGPAIEPTPPPPPPELALQVRLVEPPEPPPPPPVRGTPPRERGPRHQGRRSTPTPPAEPSANTEAVQIAAPPPVPAPAVVAPPRPSRAAEPKPGATPPPPVSLPAPAPLPLPKPVLPAGEPPALAVQIPTPVPPAPPRFQPEPVRPPQAEGNRPILSPTSLALPNVSTPAPINLPTMAMHVDVPKAVAPVSVTPAPPSLAAPEVPRLQPLPLPAQPSPIVVQQPSAPAPVEIAPKSLPQPQAPAITLGATEIQVVLAAAEPEPSPPATPVPPAKIALEQSARAPAPQPAALRPLMSAPTTIANVATPAPSLPAAAEPKTASTPASSEPAAPTQDDAATSTADTAANDASRAPDAIPQGSDNAAVGEPAGVATAPPTTASTNAATPPSSTAAGKSSGKPAELRGVGKAGANQPGAREGEQHGAVGDYVQLKPHGDTEIMRHGASNIRYKATRFDKDWTPEGESSIDTALRHAVEKTSIKRTFHLPRGLRVECVVRPLVPSSLFGCQNPDPPAVPLSEKIYDRLNVAPAQPLDAPAAAASSAQPNAQAPTPMVKFNNSAECAAARVAGGPLPPRCVDEEAPAEGVKAPAPSSSSWVPASDQFH